MIPPSANMAHRSAGRQGDDQVTVSELRRELVDVMQRLHELPDDAFKERIELKNRQHDLRARMAEALRAERRATPDSAQAIRRELNQVRRRKEQLVDQRTATSAGASGGGFGSASVVHFQQMQAEQNEALGLPELDARIAELQWELDQLTDPDEDKGPS